jgi:hypothetical protein
MMVADRLRYWIEVFENRAEGYEFEATLCQTDRSFKDDPNRDVFEGIFEDARTEYLVKARRARVVAARLSAKPSS